MSIVTELKTKIFAGKEITKIEALKLIDVPLEELTNAANEIRAVFCKNGFDLCTIINAKCGKCSEDCKYCAQSSYYKTNCVESYPLLSTDAILKLAQENDKQGVLRYSLVTSGRKLSDREIDSVCNTIRTIREKTSLQVCVSIGLQTEEQFRRIKEAGATRVHCNLESSRRYFPEVCTTHTFDQKIETLKAAKRAGLSICSGGIMGLGETMEDRIDMVISAREVGATSVPVNLLNPIPGTPYEKNKILTNDELCRIVAIFRFLMPNGAIRLAGGRGLLDDKGKRCFQSGANAAISGDMLTTAGITIERDKKMLALLGYEPRLSND